MVDIEGILEEVVVKVMGYVSRKNAFWLISMDRGCSPPKRRRQSCGFGYALVPKQPHNAPAANNLSVNAKQPLGPLCISAV
jgi:hypothetical protein